MSAGALNIPAVLGLTPKQYNEYEYFRVYKIITYILLGCYIWEFILTFHVELDLLRRKRRFRLSLAPYFITRYSCLGYLIPNLLLVHTGSPINCTANVMFLIVMASSAQVFSQVMFSLRALALWNFDRRITALLIAVWIPHAVISYCVVYNIETSWRPELLGRGGFCNMSRISIFAVPSYALLLAVDIMVGTLILCRLFSLRKVARSKFTDVLARDLFLYLLCCVVPCLAGIFIVSLNDSIALRSCLYIITTQVHAVFSCRAYLNTSKLAEQLPPHLQLRVHNEYLDPDTLRRIAGHLGIQPGLPTEEGGPAGRGAGAHLDSLPHSQKDLHLHDEEAAASAAGARESRSSLAFFQRRPLHGLRSWSFNSAISASNSTQDKDACGGGAHGGGSTVMMTATAATATKQKSSHHAGPAEGMPKLSKAYEQLQRSRSTFHDDEAWEALATAGARPGAARCGGTSPLSAGSNMRSFRPWSNGRPNAADEEDESSKPTGAVDALGSNTTYVPRASNSSSSSSFSSSFHAYPVGLEHPMSAAAMALPPSQAQPQRPALSTSPARRHSSTSTSTSTNTTRVSPRVYEQVTVVVEACDADGDYSSPAAAAAASAAAEGEGEEAAPRSSTSRRSSSLSSMTFAAQGLPSYTPSPSQRSPPPPSQQP